jgi:glucose dehydrogenase
MIYVLDRATGQILAADAVVPTAVANVDTATGRTRYTASKAVKVNQQTREICPAWTGAFAPGAGVVAAAGIVALPVSRMCMDLEPRPANYIQGTPYTGANVRLLLGPARGGEVIGWDVARRQAAWRAAEPWPVLGGTLVTPGGLVFYGTLDGGFKALDGSSGKLLWRYKGPQGILSRPVALHGADGRPYIAVVAGTGRLFGMSRTEALDPRDNTAGFGWAGALRQLPQDSDAGSTLLVFQLP